MSDIHKWAYKGFSNLLNTAQGAQGRTFGILIKNLLPNVVMTFVSIKGITAISKPVKAIREEAIAWLKEGFEKLDKKTITVCLLSFLQHVCLGTPDRAEHRTLACQTIIEFIFLLPKKQQQEFVDFLIKLSHNQKMSVRQFAVDLATSLLDLDFTAGEGITFSCQY